MCFQKASGNDFSNTWKARWLGQPFRTKFQQSRLVKLQIILIILISSIFPKVTGYYGGRAAEIFRNHKIQKAGFNGKQFATNYNMEIKCIAS